MCRQPTVRCAAQTGAHETSYLSSERLAESRHELFVGRGEGAFVGFAS
ncbi:Uncharacterised protein [Gordonia paraffinivorans]|uniref:Uncharacterized protein n=1 Tax=Gordonia paraffinivorans TaxID=175628 RepID=A0ABD7UY73_9ACTN|nr:Uncharacterised protein [Gordonia paraffinivorans]